MTESTGLSLGSEIQYADTAGNQWREVLVRCDCCPEHTVWWRAGRARICDACWGHLP